MFEKLTWSATQYVHWTGRKESQLFFFNDFFFWRNKKKKKLQPFTTTTTRMYVKMKNL